MFRLVLLTAVLLRLAAYFTLSGAHFPITTDPGAYAQIADNLRAGQGLVLNSAWGPFRAIYPPLYPLLLAALGPLLNPLIDAGIAYTLVRLGEALGSNGKLAALLYLLWPVPIFLIAVPQKDTLAILLVVQTALAVVRLRTERRNVEIARLGLCSGLLALTQPAFAPFPAIALLLLKRDARVIFASASIAVLALLPWWVRNWLVFHSFVPLTSATGYNLVVAVTGYYAPLKQFNARGELAGSRAAFHAAITFFAEHPAHVLLHRIGSTIRAVVIEAWPVTVYRESTRPLSIAILPLLELYWLALVGAAVFRFRAVSIELKLLLVACLIQFALFNFWFEFGERHRFLILPFLIFASAFGSGSPHRSASDTVRKR
jgi:hypothetical protein